MPGTCAPTPLLRFPPAVRRCILLLVALSSFHACAGLDSQSLELAVALSITGDSQTFGTGSLEGIRLATEEANAARSGPRLELKIYDNASSPEATKQNAERIEASPAALILGPSNSVTSLAGGPVYAKAGIASITTTATSDLITNNATTFRVLFKNSDQGETLAIYLSRVLGLKQAAVLVMDDAYGQTMESGFKAAATRLGLEAHYYRFTREQPLAETLAPHASEIAGLPVVFAMLDFEGAELLKILRRQGAKGPFLGGDAFGEEAFGAHFTNEPEEVKTPGWFTEGFYGLTPMLLDSANADVIDFAERFQRRFGHYPGWMAAAGYDAATLAIAATRTLDPRDLDTAGMRAAVLKHLAGLRDAKTAQAGLLGPLVFDEARGRETAIRLGQFRGGRFHSAPLQMEPVHFPDAAEIESGAIFPIHAGHFARLQQVIYSGVFVNEVNFVDQARFLFGADFYIWLRFAKNSGPGAADPTDIKFPDLETGIFDREHPVERRVLADGNVYLLWRVQGTFRNDFDLRRYPFDAETLKIRFVNAHSAANHIVYALDVLGAEALHGKASAETPFGASATAFHRLTQWTFSRAYQSRESFVAHSSLGDPQRVGRENYRELSGYAASFDLRRKSLPTLLKNLLPLFIMTCILYASLHFPPVLVQPKVAVAITVVLTGMVLLNLVNSQLGAVGYMAAVEYAFFLYFALGLLCIISVLYSEHQRAIGSTLVADRCDFWTRVLFIAAVAGLVLAAFYYARPNP